ncbi:MAG: S8 family serine peptidase [Actinobacteria bacterium]|nr:S8 family serine peptidase [Actinomycetota bacterium]
MHRRWVTLPVILALLAVLACPVDGARAQGEAPPPQLPILLLNGAVYTYEYDTGAIPESFRVEEYSPRVTALYMVQCEGLIKEAWVEDLRRIGGEPRGYLPYNTLLAGMDGDTLSRMGELDFVSWHGLYQPYFKISPALQLRLSQGGEVDVLVEVFSSRLLEDTLRALQALPVQIVASQADSWCAVIALHMPVETMSAVAALPAVEWMELCAGGALPGIGSGAGDLIREGTTLPQVTPGGEELVALGDTGLGTGGLQGLPAPLAGNVLSLDSLRGDDGADPNGHGTAVAGCVTSVEYPGVVASPATRPAIIAYATGYGLGCPPQPLSLHSLLDSAYARGARVFLSGSVPEGRESLGAYGIYTSQRDAFVWRYPGMMVVEPAGNEGTDSDDDGVVDGGSLLGGTTAKNVLSVGGCESPAPASEAEPAMSYSQLEECFPGRFPSEPLREDSSADSQAGMAAFSSRGPTRDGRIKPDLVAPATDIITVASGGAEGEAGIVASAAPGYVRAYGTSMAAAQAAADLAGMRLPLSAVQELEPSAALLKAFLVNGAVDLTPGQYGNEEMEIPQAPNAVEGWGRLDLDAFMRTGSWVKVLDDTEGMRLGESRVFRIEVTSGSELRVTLAWSDYPSLPEARLHLVNDLDLRLVDPEGNVYYPNDRNSRDPLNNVERIILDIEEKPGDYTIELEAWNTPFSPQPFALVAQVL